MTESASAGQDCQTPSVFGIPPDTDDIPQINGHGEKDEAAQGEEPPTKRRRVSETTPKPKPRPKTPSPPWKKFTAEGPTTFNQNGKRRSGRVNEIPLELQPPSDKRKTRGAQSSKSQNATTNGTNSLHARDIPSASVAGSKKQAVTSSTASQQPSAKTAPSPKRSHRKSHPAEQTSTLVRSHKKKIQASTNPQSAPAHAPLSKTRRSGRTFDATPGEKPRSHILKTEGVPSESPRGKLARIKFRVKPAELPLTHPGLVIQRPRRYANLTEFLDKESNVPVEEGGLFTTEDTNDYTAEAIAKDAQILIRAEDAAAPGGVLSPGVCSVYQPEEQEQPPQQYAHLDHLNRAAIELRRLMGLEEKKHKQTAKRLAEACRDEWRRKQPKSSEQLEADERKAAQGRYRNLVKTLQGTWDNVKGEVNRRRLLEWELQEKDRVRKALNEAVDISTQKLDARRVHRDSEMPSDEDEDEEGDGEGTERSDDGDDKEDETDDNSAGSGFDDGESNMSSESEEDEDETLRPDALDDHLTPDQLREKYSSLPSLPAAPVDIEMVDADDRGDSGSERDGDTPILDNTFDDSDDSIDMDDDMGSSDEGNDIEDDSEEEADDSEDAEAEGGELGLLGFLAPTELKSIKRPPEGTSPTSESNDRLGSELLDHEDSVPDATIRQSPVTQAGIEVIEPTAPAIEVPKLVSEVISPDQSTPTPRTTETRPSEIDSASSVDHHSRQVTQSTTPQPTSDLKTPIPFLLRGTLREYQHYGLDWLAGLYANNTNGILADEMGLGKTIQTIALLAHLACEHEVWGPHLVIVPTSVMLNWEMEFKKFLPGFKVLTYYGTQEERKRKRHGWGGDSGPNVIITSYQLVLQDKAVFKSKRWHYMILDEAHNIKNFQSQRWQVMLTFNTRARLLLTGTPLQNNLTELWSLLFFLMPSDGTEQSIGGFANLKEFHEWFGKPSEQILEHGREHMDDEARAIISKLHKVLRPYLLRRLKADVEKQMPGKYEHVEWCRLSKRQRELYDGFLSRDDTRGTLASGNYLSIINCLMQLRKVCNHPDLFIERAIMTSFPIEKSAVADFEIKDLLVRRRLLREEPMSRVSLDFLNLVPTKHETLSDIITTRVHFLSAQKALMDAREAQRTRAQNAFTSLDPSTTKSNLVYLESASRWGRFEELQHCVYLNALRRQQKPIYGSRLVELLTLGVNERPLKPRPKCRSDMLLWLEDSSTALAEMIPTISSRSRDLNSIIQKFSCVTPSVVARDMTTLTLSPKIVNAFQSTVPRSERDPFHEARMRLSIQFPDKRLLQYDCGKLQTLAKLLRKLQAQGSRALIFTQMTKVLDILEQFLNIHGYKYLRLDGSTKVEQRQALTDRFNNDNRILVFILSSRSGGLGINLTGADTVIFYDLDWNPAMDKQCQDRAHRIGQTRDVHIYRLVSEHTIEANILRKANQKRMLDDVVIQEGEFTTDYFTKASVRDTLDDGSHLLDTDDAAAAANAAMDRVLGGSDNSKDISRVLAQAEDKEDVVAANIAEREILQTDAADFDENAVVSSTTPASTGTPLDGLPEEVNAVDAPMAIDDEDEDEVNAWGQKIDSTDNYMLNLMTEQLKDTPVELPKDKNRSKRGKDRRSHRATR